jgi:hypothetical protein
MPHNITQRWRRRQGESVWVSLLESAATAQAEPITVLTATASHDDNGFTQRDPNQPQPR